MGFVMGIPGVLRKIYVNEGLHKSHLTTGGSVSGTVWC